MPGDIMSTPRYTVDDFNDIPGIDPSSNGVGPARDSWLPLNLADLDDTPPEPPTLGGFGIVYRGKRHVFSGPQESAKTLAAYAIGIETLRAIPNRYIAIIDFEMGKRSARTRLLELGATLQELARILYIEPEVPATIDRIALLVAMQPQIVIIDAAAGAYALQGLDDNNRGDVERFTALYTNAFFQNGIATITLDHVVKNTETRGKYAIGSERKTGGVDVHLGFDTILPIKRGSTGLYKITTHKDRDGWHERGRLADLHLTSHPDTHTITWEWRQTEHLENPNAWMPTIYMERVSKYLQDDGEPCSRTHLVDNVEGGTDYIRSALEHLKEHGYVTETKGPRHSRLFTHHRPFTVSEWEKQHPTPTPPDPASTPPEAESLRPRLPASPPTGGAGEGGRRPASKNNTTPPDDPETIAMLEQYGLNDSWIDELTPREHPPHDLHQETP
jgi:hypothetical protein